MYNIEKMFKRSNHYYFSQICADYTTDFAEFNVMIIIYLRNLRTNLRLSARSLF